MNEYEFVTVKVMKQKETFQLASAKGWIPALGHRIDVDEFAFAACPVNRTTMRVVELESGTGFLDAKIPPHVQTSEEVLVFLREDVVFQLSMLVDELSKPYLRREFKRARTEVVKRLGFKPVTSPAQ